MEYRYVNVTPQCLTSQGTSTLFHVSLKKFKFWPEHVLHKPLHLTLSLQKVAKKDVNLHNTL